MPLPSIGIGGQRESLSDSIKRHPALTRGNVADSHSDIYDRKWPYDKGEGYPPRDVVKSYEWFEISVRFPLAHEMAETNRGEISRRDHEAAKMSATQIEAAQRQARRNGSGYTPIRYVHSGSETLLRILGGLHHRTT
jgi:hypothetical protein